MSFRNRLIAYGAALAALIILFAVGFATSPARRRSQVEPLLPGFAVETVVRFEVTTGERTMSITRDTGAWYLQRDNTRYPARFDRIDVMMEELEQARIVLRQIREDVRTEIAKAEKDKSIGEDDKYKFQDDLDKLVKEYNDKIKEIGEKKEKEVNTI